MPHSTFSQPLLDWYQHHGRKNLPWQHPRHVYRVWISEIMLQQTQVSTVIPYFNRFMDRFPNIHSLALAKEDEVLALWSGLGYYSRARNLLKTAILIQTELQGQFPSDLDQLIKLPGIGASTAAAIVSLAFDKPAAILDGNVKRILSRYFLINGHSNLSNIQKQLWQLANDCIPNSNAADYTQAIMDLGATCCRIKNPNCDNCPLRETCQAHIKNKVLEYPKKNVRKIRPTLNQQFLLLHTKDNLIYLEKRPPTGLWGGLWCLPHIEMEHCATTYITESYALKIGLINEIMSFKHSFSHFHLKIKALSIQATMPCDNSKEASGHWFSATDIKTLGLAKPMQLIINTFLDRQQPQNLGLCNLRQLKIYP